MEAMEIPAIAPLLRCESEGLESWLFIKAVEEESEPEEVDEEDVAGNAAHAAGWLLWQR